MTLKVDINQEAIKQISLSIKSCAKMVETLTDTSLEAQSAMEFDPTKIIPALCDIGKQLNELLTTNDYLEAVVLVNSLEYDIDAIIETYESIMRKLKKSKSNLASLKVNLTKSVRESND